MPLWVCNQVTTVLWCWSLPTSLTFGREFRLLTRTWRWETRRQLYPWGWNGLDGCWGWPGCWARSGWHPPAWSLPPHPRTLPQNNIAVPRRNMKTQFVEQFLKPYTLIFEIFLSISESKKFNQNSVIKSTAGCFNINVLDFYAFQYQGNSMK